MMWLWDVHIFNKEKYRKSWKLTSNDSSIKIYLIVIKANLELDKIRLNIPSHFAMTRPFQLFLQAPFGLGTWQNFLDKNLLVLENQI